MAHMMLESKRSTRGTRMSALVGQAAEDDEAFWSHDVWKEGDGSDEESFHTDDDEEKPDVFDSDFNESETEDDEEEDEEEERIASRGGNVNTKQTNRYKDPAMRKALVKPLLNPVTVQNGEEGSGLGDVEAVQPPQKKKKLRVTIQEDVGPRALRQSTKTKTLDADVQRNKRDEESKSKRQPRTPRPKNTHFNMEELLKEALDTEEVNNKWLEHRKFLLQQKEELEKKAAAQTHTARDFIRFFSRRNVGTYVTFSNSDAVPACLRPEFNQPPPAPRNICAITDQPAKYVDPLTKFPYADVAAFKELRRRHSLGLLSVKQPAPVSSSHGQNFLSKSAPSGPIVAATTSSSSFSSSHSSTSAANLSVSTSIFPNNISNGTTIAGVSRSGSALSLRNNPFSAQGQTLLLEQTKAMHFSEGATFHGSERSERNLSIPIDFDCDDDMLMDVDGVDDKDCQDEGQSDDCQLVLRLSQKNMTVSDRM